MIPKECHMVYAPALAVAGDGMGLGSTFTAKDLIAEAGLQAIRSRDLLGAVEIIRTGLQYNEAKKSGDSERIVDAFRALHPELKLFKKNFLNRGKDHW
jgi:hypothetical protein